MTKPLFINDFSFYSILGGDKNAVYQKLVNGVRGDFTPVDVAGVMRPVALIDKESLLKIDEDYLDSKVNRLTLTAILPLENSIKKTLAKFGKDRVGIFIGTCDNGSEASLAAVKYYKENGGFSKDYSLEFQAADFAGKFIAERYSVTGMLSVHSTACASSVSAFVSARNNIYAGNCDAAIVGGVDMASLSAILGFASLEAMSDKPTNPFSANRSGLTLGDGAAYFIVTKEYFDDLCTKECKGLKILGFGESADADHITAPRADGEGAFNAMNAAIKDAEISADKICYVNLHGTGTRLNDSMEAIAVHKLFGEVCVSSTKSLTGHTLGAAGALETAFCCLALKGGKMPAHVFDGVLDEKLPKLHLVKHHEKLTTNYCISNSFAFGGCNVSLVIAKE